MDSTGIFDINTLHYTEPRSLEINDVPFQKSGSTVKYIRNQVGLYVFVEGTGRVYQINIGSDDLQLSRLDSTIFFGYNFGSYEFSYRDTLFSYGGYGYWHHNGHLRYFIPVNGEWELAHTLKEIPARNDNGERNNIWADVNDGKLYIIKAADHSDSIYALDLPSKQWKTLGLSYLPKDFSYVLSTPWGPMCLFTDNNQPAYSLINLKMNEVMELSKSKNEKLASLWSSNTKVYAKDSTIYLTTKSSPDELVAIKLSQKDFISTGKNIYEEIPEKNTVSLFIDNLSINWITLVTVLISFCLGLLVPFQYLKFKRNTLFANGHGSSNGLTHVFDEKEKDVIKLVLNNSSVNKVTSIDAVNQILAIAEKPPDLQKKHRSDILSSINNKYRQARDSNENLIASKRSDYDKRSFEYYIEESKIEEIKIVFNGH